ncbi:MAG: hypothetical protein LBI53_01550 [Candidatus Peribacteria bacterium]|nr:hypothetical protein [Candidatus Peribacteria bacterium]
MGKLADIRGFDTSSRLASMRIYLLLVIIAGGYTALYFYDRGDIVEKYLNQLPFYKEPITIEQPKEDAISEKIDEYIFEGTGSLITGEEMQREDTTPADTTTAPTSSTEDPITTTGITKNVTM